MDCRRLLICLMLLPLLAGAGFSARAETSGRLRLEGFAFPESQPAGVPREEGGFLFQFEGKARLSDSARIRFEPSARLSTVRRMTDRFDGDLRDSFLEFKSEGVHVQAGSFIKTWEGTDGLNPMDIATVRNYRDPLNAENLGSIGIAADGAFTDKFTWDAMYIPWQTPSRLPGAGSPWLPRRTAQSVSADGGKILLPDSPQYDVRAHDARGSALRDNWGARVQLHLESLDFSLAYFVGSAQIPVFEPELTGTLVQSSPYFIVQATNPIVIHPIEYRRRTAAGAVVWTHESWILRFAGRYDQPFDSDLFLPGWSDQMVASIEKTVTLASQSVVLSLGYAHEDGAAQNESPISSEDPFHRAILAGTRWPLTDKTLLFVGGLVDMYKDSSLLRVNLQRKFDHRVSVDGGLEWVRGSDQSLLGIWSHQSRAMLGAEYQF